MIKAKFGKENFSFKVLTQIMNDCLKNNFFPDILKNAEITPCSKNGDKGEKEYDIPVSILSNFSKVFERLIYNQLNEFMEAKSSKFLTSFRKKHNTQYALLRMIESWKTQLNKRKKIGVIITNLSKAFDTLNHNLLVAKLKAYGVNLNAASFIKSYLTNIYQHCKIGDSFSEWERIVAGVPQGSILGPLLFNIFINDIFLYIENSDLSNYADDSTLYASGESLSIIIENLKGDFFKDL